MASCVLVPAWSSCRWKLPSRRSRSNETDSPATMGGAAGLGSWRTTRRRARRRSLVSVTTTTASPSASAVGASVVWSPDELNWTEVKMGRV